MTAFINLAVDGNAESFRTFYPHIFSLTINDDVFELWVVDMSASDIVFYIIVSCSERKYSHAGVWKSYDSLPATVLTIKICFTSCN